ncbi:MAG: glycerol-3-phosphate 1-O-acyltransferase PlsY [Vicinamibacterales bacterium]|jgi:glycerol-3-phosphate acyltransferase PlsY|nr:glycerol-3-phosphate 1-O-acyltransferase PlsY [Vicinamibacterales bacterium]|tara:strand:- start:111 stop:701 length:591 start_codon:yes stop_codon:yes gene_type:complete
MKMTDVWIIALGYFAGSVPFAFLIPRCFAGVDVRNVGSGNIGAANVFRATRPLIGLAVFGLDVFKGFAIVLLATRLGMDDPTRTAAGVATIMGHIYPVWLRFRGGKGVATAGGVFGVLSPIAALASVVIFLVVAWWTRYISAGSIVASLILVPLLYVMAAPPSTMIGGSLVTVLILYRHRGNLIRLSDGTERRFGQ